ncbi:MAG: flippase [Patescibacteria group bacterium]|nr:flippase [Patescibacteria group bacterium]
MSRILKTIFRNTFWLGAAELINGVLMFFLVIWLARYLGATVYGKLMFTISIVNLFSIITDFGLTSLFTRQVARYKNEVRRYVANIISIKIFLSIIAFILLFVVLFIVKKDNQTITLLYLMSIWMILNSFSTFFQSVFRAFEKMKYEALIKVIYVTNIFILGVITISLNLNVIFLAWFYVLSVFVSALIAILFVKKYFCSITLKFNFKFWKELLKKSWPFALSAMFIMIYYYMDSVMLGFMGQDKEVGWYNAAYRPIMFLIMVSGLISTAFFPAISKLYKQSINRLENLIYKFSKTIFIISIPMAIGGVLVGHDLIILLFGAEYTKSILAFQILIWTASIIYISSIFGPTLQACDQQKKHLFGVGLGALMNIILNIILIPLFSLYGAAIATLSAEIAVVIYMHINLRKIISYKISKNLWRPILSSLAMAIFLLLVNNLYVIIQILLGSLIYFIILFLLRGINKKDIIFFKQVVLNK